MAKPTIPAPANKEVTVPFNPTKSSAINTPTHSTITLNIEAIKSAICCESSERRKMFFIRLPAKRASIENIMAIITATIKLGM